MYSVLGSHAERARARALASSASTYIDAPRILRNWDLFSIRVAARRHYYHICPAGCVAERSLPRVNVIFIFCFHLLFFLPLHAKWTTVSEPVWVSRGDRAWHRQSNIFIFGVEMKIEIENYHINHLELFLYWKAARNEKKKLSLSIRIFDWSSCRGVITQHNYSRAPKRSGRGSGAGVGSEFTTARAELCAVFFFNFAYFVYFSISTETVEFCGILFFTARARVSYMHKLRMNFSRHANFLFAAAEAMATAAASTISTHVQQTVSVFSAFKFRRIGAQIKRQIIDTKAWINIETPAM